MSLNKREKISKNLKRMDRILKKGKLDLEQDFTRHKLELACQQLQMFEPLLRRKYTRFASLGDSAYTIFNHLIVFEYATNRMFFSNREVATLIKQLEEQEQDNIKTIKCIDTLMDQVPGKLQMFTSLIRGNLMPNTAEYCRNMLKIFLERTDRISKIFEEAIEDLSYFRREMERLEVENPFINYSSVNSVKQF